MPSGISPRTVKPLNTILKEKVRFDICLGDKKNKHVHIEIKIIETVRGLRESIGNIALLNLKDNDKKFAGIIVAYIISSMGGKWLV